MNAETKSHSGKSKSHLDYWKERLFKRGDEWKDSDRKDPNWHVRISVGGRQRRVPLQTPNKDEAAAIALKVYESARANGWEATIEKFPSIWPRKYERIESPTVGEFLQAVEKHAVGFTGGFISPITFKTYSRKFRRLASSIAKIKGDVSRFYRGEGSTKWRAAVDAIKLATLTPDAITKWQEGYVADKRGNPLRQDRAKMTAKSILRNSASLFSDKVMERLKHDKVEIELPDPLPFANIDMSIGRPPKYKGTFDATQLAKEANSELAKAETELFKIFLLALGVGLRRGEIDRLTWPQFDWTGNKINIDVTAHGGTKTPSSKAPVEVDPEVMHLFKKFKAKATGEFVLESTVPPRPGADWHHYRCDCTFKRFTAWLRGKGVDAHNPIHTLRKEFGSLLCNKFGVFAAKEALRHSDIRITVAHYVDQRERIHLEVGKMLTGDDQMP